MRGFRGSSAVVLPRDQPQVLATVMTKLTCFLILELTLKYETHAASIQGTTLLTC